MQGEGCIWCCLSWRSRGLLCSSQWGQQGSFLHLLLVPHRLLRAHLQGHCLFLICVWYRNRKIGGTFSIWSGGKEDWFETRSMKALCCPLQQWIWCHIVVGEMTELHRLLQGVLVHGQGSEAGWLRIFSYGMQQGVLSQGKVLGRFIFLLQH